MKAETYKSLGMSFALQVPETVKEFDTNAKREGACLAEAIANIIYRGCLAEFRDVFLHGREADKEANLPAIAGVEQVSKISRKLKETGKKDSDGNPVMVYDESEADYFDRVLAQLKVERTHFQALADEVAKSIVFDASARERKPAAPKKLATKYKEVAEKVYSSTKRDKFVKDVEKETGIKLVVTATDTKAADFNEKRGKDIEAFGWAVKALTEAREKAQLAAMV